MIITHQYRIKPSPDQVATMDTWLELLRRHWNYALGQRLDWLNGTRCQIDRCSIVSCPIGEIPNRVDYYTQQAALKETKVLFPAYKEIYSEVQQINLQRLDKAWIGWLVPDKDGKRKGRPRFKKAGELRSFSFSRINHPKAVAAPGPGFSKSRGEAQRLPRRRHIENSQARNDASCGASTITRRLHSKMRNHR